MPPEADWQTRLAAVDWPRFRTLYGAADEVPELIAGLHSPDEAMALRAAGDLSAGLCHRHAQIASAALPAFPFIVERLPSAGEKVTAEILNMLVGFAISTDPVRMRQFASAVGKRRVAPPGWVQELRDALRTALPQVARYATHQNPAIAESAKMFVDEMGKDTVPA